VALDDAARATSCSTRRRSRSSTTSSTTSRRSASICATSNTSSSATVHLDHVGGAAKIQEATGARVVAIAQDWDMMAALDGKQGNRDGGGINKMPKKDMVVKEGDHLDLGDQHLTFHWTPGHTPGVLTTEGIKVYDNGTPHTAILMGGGGYRGGLKEAKESLESAKKVAAIKASK
jgi:metallo-beta-lactamase class B